MKEDFFGSYAEAPLTAKHIGPITRAWATAVKEFVAPRDRRLAALEQRIVELEQRATIQYKGVWSEHEPYNAGDFVTFDGSVWHCGRSTRSRPGTPGGSWLLAVKHGRDGRDGKDSR